MLSTIEDFKPLVGKLVYAKSTGNNVRYGRAKVMMVTAVKRKYVELDGVSFCPKTGATQDAINSGYGCNAGYKFFADKESIDKYEQDINVRKQLKELTGSFSGWISRLDIEDVEYLIKKLDDK